METLADILERNESLSQIDAELKKFLSSIENYGDKLKLLHSLMFLTEQLLKVAEKQDFSLFKRFIEDEIDKYKQQLEELKRVYDANEEYYKINRKNILNVSEIEHKLKEAKNCHDEIQEKFNQFKENSEQ